MSPEDFIHTINDWAKNHSDILGIGLCGSHARGTARPDSDMDLVLICKNPNTFLEDQDWLEDFGTHTSVLKEDYGRVQSLRVNYTNGIEIEFGITNADWIALPLDGGTQRVIQDGFRILHDPSGVIRKALETL